MILKWPDTKIQEVDYLNSKTFKKGCLRSPAIYSAYLGPAARLALVEKRPYRFLSLIVASRTGILHFGRLLAL